MKWDQERLQWYLRAGEKSDYPRVFLDRIKPFLQASDILLDIGAGPGLFARELLPLVRKIYNLEPDPVSRSFLEQKFAHQGKMVVLEGSWPQDIPDLEVDVTISAFSGAGVMAREDSLRLICRLTRRHIFLIAPAGPKDFGAGLEKPSSPLPYEQTESLLQQLGLQFHRELISFDFGQPVADLEEATRFLSRQLKIPPQMARNHADRIARREGDELYLPNLRRSALLRIDFS